MSQPRDEEQRPTVILLHGLGRTARSMTRMRKALDAAGYSTWAKTYPSRRMKIEALAEHLADQIEADIGGDHPIFAVTHSLGGILVRCMEPLLEARRLNLRGMVMVAPPNQGSRVAARLQGKAMFRMFTGPAGSELAQEPKWPDPPGPFAVIAGTRGVSATNPTSWITRLFAMLPGESDGTVAVEETQIEGMADFAKVSADHTWILNHPDTHRLVISFIQNGAFS